MNTVALRLTQPLTDEVRSYFVKNNINIYFHDDIMPDFCFAITDKTKQDLLELSYISKVEAARTNGVIC